MSDLRSQSGSNREAPEVNSRNEVSPNDIAVHIRQMREFTPPLLLATIGSIFMEDWTRVMSQSFRALFIPKNLKVTIACIFLRREPIAWFERAVQAYLYRLNKFRSLLKRNFGSLGMDCERIMIKEFENCTDDSSDGGFRRYEGASPSDVPSSDVEDDNSDDNDGSDDGDDEEDPKEDWEEESDGDKTKEKGVVHEG